MSFAEVPIQPAGQNWIKDTKELLEESSIMETGSVALKESTSEKEKIENENIVTYIQGEFQKSKDKRLSDENRWIECYRNYRGLYNSTTQFTSTERSRAFIKITKTKVQAAYAQIVDVLFAGNKFPIGVDPPRIPYGVDGDMNFDPKEPPAQSPQMTPAVAALFGPKKGLWEKAKDKLKSGIGLTPTSVTFNPAEEAARKMEKMIHDQLDEADASKSLRSVVAEMCIFGTGIYKGPFAMDKEYPKWDSSGVYAPIMKTIPHMEYVSIWDAYPDADARNMSEAEKFIQRHRLSRTQLRALKKRPAFRKKNIEKIIKDGANYVPQYWETELSDTDDNTVYERWEVLEYWGMVDADMAKEAGIKIPTEYNDFDEFQVNIWVCGDEVLRLVINPFKPSRIPYHAVPYELNPYSFFGIGVAENMMDSQLLMNGFMRMAVDNAALSANVVLEVNEDLLVPGQSTDVHPGKIFRAQSGVNQKAIQSIDIKSTTQECMTLFDKARQLSDESTGMPSYAHGMTGIQSTGKTAAGMSMLMGAAAQNIKAVVRNLDDYLLAPLGKDLFSFNMQFNFDKDFIGDVTVVAKGTESLMRNEVRSQKLSQFAQFAAANPALSPFVKWDYILREFAASMDLEEDKVVNDPRAAQIQAMDMAKMQEIMGGPMGAQQGQQTQAQGNGQVQGGSVPSPDDPTQNGNGNIGPGASPPPGAQGFSGSVQ